MDLDLAHRSKSAAKKAKKPPIKYITQAAIKSHSPQRRRRPHARPSSGSARQGALRPIHLNTDAAESMTPAPANTQTLLAENQTSPGTLDTRPANTAPAPMTTRNAGSAQHNKVETLVSSASVGKAVSRSANRMIRHHSRGEWLRSYSRLSSRGF